MFTARDFIPWQVRQQILAAYEGGIGRYGRSEGASFIHHQRRFLKIKSRDSRDEKTKGMEITQDGGACQHISGRSWVWKKTKAIGYSACSDFKEVYRYLKKLLGRFVIKILTSTNTKLL